MLLQDFLPSLPLPVVCLVLRDPSQAPSPHSGARRPRGLQQGLEQVLSLVSFLRLHCWDWWDLTLGVNKGIRSGLMLVKKKRSSEMLSSFNLQSVFVRDVANIWLYGKACLTSLHTFIVLQRRIQYCKLSVSMKKGGVLLLGQFDGHKRKKNNFMEKYCQNIFYILLFGVLSEAGLLTVLILNGRCRSSTLYSGFSGHIADLMMPSVFKKNAA